MPYTGLCELALEKVLAHPKLELLLLREKADGQEQEWRESQESGPEYLVPYEYHISSMIFVHTVANRNLKDDSQMCSARC